MVDKEYIKKEKLRIQKEADEMSYLPPEIREQLKET